MLLLVAVVLPPTVVLEPELDVATTWLIAPEDPAAQHRAHVAERVSPCVASWCLSGSASVSYQKQPSGRVCTLCVGSTSECSAIGSPNRLTSPQHMLTLGRDGDVCAGKHSLGARVVHNLLHNLLDLSVVVGSTG